MNEEMKAVELTDEELEQVSGGSVKLGISGIPGIVNFIGGLYGMNEALSEHVCSNPSCSNYGRKRSSAAANCPRCGQPW